MAEQAALDLLRRLARDFNVRDARKLYEEPRKERGGGPQRPPAGRSDRLLPKHPNCQQLRPRGHGRLHHKGRHQSAAAETVARAAAEAIPELVQEEGNYVVTTDEGKKFNTLEAVHCTKRPEDRNATAVVDRTIQTLKKDLAGEVARRGGKWGDHVTDATEAYNARPHEAVHAAPEDVETQPATQFRVLQDNADKFQHNNKLTEGRQRRLQQAGAFRAPRAALTRRPTAAPVRQLRDFNRQAPQSAWRLQTRRCGGWNKTSAVARDAYLPLLMLMMPAR